jgi:hypothetical protein
MFAARVAEPKTQVVASHQNTALPQPRPLSAATSGSIAPAWDFGRILVTSTDPAEQALYPPLEPKLKIGAVNDPSEHEADRIAHRVMRMAQPAKEQACACGGACSKCQAARAVHEPEPLRRKAAAPASPKRQDSSPIAGEALRSPGPPLDSATRAFMESRFGHEFSNMCVSTGEPLTSQGPPPQPGPGVPGGVAQAAGSGTGSGGTAPATPACEPKGLDRADFLRTKGATKKDLGLTWPVVTYPNVSTKPTKDGGVMVARTTASMKISSVFMRVGSYTEGSEKVSEQSAGSCPSRVYPLKLVIGPEGAEKIKEGEQEHCSDLQHAFDISLKEFADAVNDLSNSRRVFQNQKEAEDELTRTTGVAPDKWQEVFRCLSDKTASRDSKWHTAIPLRLGPDFIGSGCQGKECETVQCKEVQNVVWRESLPEVGKHPTADLIKGCGEKQPSSTSKPGDKPAPEPKKEGGGSPEAP